LHFCLPIGRGRHPGRGNRISILQFKFIRARNSAACIVSKALAVSLK
jgi:hypothetical protein